MMREAYRRTCGLILLGCSIVVLGSVWVHWSHSRTSLRIVEPGARLASKNLDISGRTLVAIPPTCGVSFSTVRKPNGQDQFAFVILFRYGSRIESFDFTRSSGNSVPECMLDHFGRWAQTKAAFALNGKRINVAYRIELDESGTKVANESLTVGENQVDTAAGRLFLIDLTTEPLRYRQVDAQLPAPPVQLDTAEDAEEAAEAIRRSLIDQYSEIKALVRY